MPDHRRLVVVANRLPVHRVKQRGRQTWETSPGGLVSAMSPFLEEYGGAWVGWAGIAGRAPKAFEHNGMQIRPVPISAEQLESFYEGFSNSTLWPLYHDAVRPPQYHRRWWWPYAEVNRVFASATAETLQSGDVVWVHDYQLQLVPGMLRDMVPDVRTGFFLHIPFPPEELFAQIPWRRQILEGMLGADVVGFHTMAGVRNFIAACKQYTDATGSGKALEFRGRKVRVDAFPISIDVERMESLAENPDVRHRAARLRDDLSSSRTGIRKIFLGVDRLDYTKGIDRRLRAFEELLRRGRYTVDDCVFVQIAVPSREKVTEYEDLRSTIEQYSGRINGEYGRPGRTAVHYMRTSVPPEELVAYYLASDALVVTPFRDGMNLVAKEYVAANIENAGSLILSEFAGAADEFGGTPSAPMALLVNPHDIDGLANSMETALAMDDAEATARMERMRRAVQKHDVYRWAGSFLGALRQ
ncbi:MAG: trehalose-6-phosphate synthase [Planctomycetota bacterium]